MKYLRNMILAAAAALSVVGAQRVQAQDTQQAIAQDSVIETIKRRGALKVGMATFVPWAMRDKDGDLIGFEIDVAKKLAEDMGVEVEFIPTAWDGIIPALIAGNFDVIIGGMSITMQRNLTVNFTEPYAKSSFGVMSHIELTEGMVWPDDYNSTDVTFSCRRGATPCDYIKVHFPKATLRLFDDQAQTVQEVLNGNAEVMLSSQPLPAFTIYDNPEVVYSPTDELISPADSAFAVRKGDPDALNFFNNWIRYRTNDGWLQERHSFWFDGRPWADQVPE
ncbi:transporter substrate-binding domain-containing protein [Pseudoruegeria sp. HB172150]|uniref:transporter substrate-binding domain-containing protein n=1 Tax=Pseudoruegeria sp. HB172150 TaxID=2721164 RepID=UPI001557CEE5|nr:transporter substrate-binding domain-containing protein [Pseudoruegeria sp. HB172150]